ncbi:TlpA family protein disulfide reductase [Paenibacillus marinisediminis]
MEKLLKKPTRETGMAIGTNLSNMSFINYNDTNIQISDYKENTALVFISLHCMQCIDLLPSIQELIDKLKIPFILFSTGDVEDNIEMANYFNWEFPVISINTKQLEEIFKITYLPFLMIIDKNHIIKNKGVVLDKENFEFIYSNIGD